MAAYYGQVPMTALAHRSMRRLYRPAVWSGIGPFLVVALSVVAVGVASTSPRTLRVAVAIPIAALLAAVCLRSYRWTVILILIWLTVLGMIRRLLSGSGELGGSDVLLLVAPVVIGLLVVVASRKGAFSDQTTFTKSVLILCALLVLSALNPLQGGISVGAAGLLFVMVPLLWFWVGRALVNDELLSRVFRVLSFVALGAAVYGLFQVYRGFPDWDQRWIDTKGYTALQVGSSVRPFASFASSAEYVGLLSIGVVIWAMHLRRATRALPAIAAITLLGWALTVASVRSPLVVVPIALGVTFAASRGFGFGRTALIGIGALFILGLVVSQFDPSGVGGAQTSELVSRQISGLSDPFDPNVSTVPLHVNQVVRGLGRAVQNPLGQGVGSVTIAAEKFGGESYGTESDPSNVAVATGIPGLLGYCFVLVIGFRLAFRTARDRRDLLSLVALGILIVTLFQWFNGGSYSVAPLPWLMLGWLDRRSLSPGPSSRIPSRGVVNGSVPEAGAWRSAH